MSVKANREAILAALGSGLEDDEHRDRLAEGFNYIVDLKHPIWPSDNLNKIFLPIWARSVDTSHRMDMPAQKYIDILINSITQDIVVDSTSPVGFDLRGVPATWRVGAKDPEAEFWTVASDHYMKLISLIPA